METLNLAIQQNLLALLAHDDEHGKLVAQIAKPEQFEGDYRVIAAKCAAYWHEHGEAPKVHTADVLSDEIQGRKGQTYRRVLLNMAQLSGENMNAKYVLNGLKVFNRQAGLKIAIQKAAEEISRPEPTSIERTEEILADILRARDYQFDPGVRLLDTDRLMAWLEKHQVEFSSGVKELDDRGVTPARGTVYLKMAGASRGKTWGLIHIGKRAILKRKKVLHVTLEMSEEECMMRYFQSLFSVTKWEEAVPILKLDTDREGKLRRFKKDTIKPDFRFSDHELALELGTRIRTFGATFENLVIKRFPTRQLTVSGLRSYLDSLEAVEGFIPDMVILDYIGIMKTDEKNYRISLSTALEDFRGLMVERNMAGVTAQQLSKEGDKASLAGLHHVAEAWAMAGTIDIGIAYSASDLEQNFGLGRLYVVKARSAESKFAVLLTQSYKIGQFCLESMPLRKTDYDEALQEIAGDHPLTEAEEDEDE